MSLCVSIINYCTRKLAQGYVLLLLHASWIDHSRKYHDIPYSSLFVTPKFCLSIVFSFSWELKWSQEKLKTRLMQNFGMTNKEHYGIFWSGQLEQRQLLGMIFFPATYYFMMLYWIQLFRERLSEKMCTRQSPKVIWDMINTLFLTTVAVEPTFVAFLYHSQTHFHGLSYQFFQISLKKRELITIHNAFQDCRVHFSRQPLSKQLYLEPLEDVICMGLMVLDSTKHVVMRGTLGGTQYRNTVRENGKYRNIASEIV